MMIICYYIFLVGFLKQLLFSGDEEIYDENFMEMGENVYVEIIVEQYLKKINDNCDVLNVGMMMLLYILVGVIIIFYNFF